MIKFENVSKVFGTTTALEGIDFEIESGEFVFLIGPSGAGKTTLIELILREYLPTAGRISVGETDLQRLPKRKVPEYRRRIGVVFQDFKLLTDQTVFENVATALRVLGKTEREIKEEITNILELVGLDKRTDFFPAQLSAGELQRACLARAVIGQPDLILADEPTGNLDLMTANQIVDLLKKINQAGKTVIMATHNFEIVNKANERVIELKEGRLISDEKKGKYLFK